MKATVNRCRHLSWLLSLMLATACLLALVALSASAAAHTSGLGNGAKRFDDLRELNNKLAREIAKLEQGERNFDPGQVGRTLKDLEVTKLRAVDQFPDVFGLPYGESFRQLSCIDGKIAVGQELLRLLGENRIAGNKHLRVLATGKILVHALLISLIEQAKACKDSLESELSRASSVPPAVSDDLRELNNKFERALSKLDQGERNFAPEQWRRILADLEATKLRAVDGFPEVLDPAYGTIFRGLSCVDGKIAVGQELLRLLGENRIAGNKHLRILATGKILVHALLIGLLKQAKGCKDTLEVELMHSFDLKPSAQTEVGVNPTTPSGTDTQNPNKLNAPKTLEHAYAHDGFIGRHEQDYLANGVDGSNPDSWPSGRNVLFFDVFDLFGSARGAQKANTASQQNLKSSGFTQIQNSSLGPGETAFQHQAAGSSLLSTIIYVQRGTFIMKIAGACNGCAKGSIESTLESEAQTQLNRAVLMGFPGPAPSGSSGSGGSGGSTGGGSGSGGSGGCSGDANLTVTLSGNAAPSGANFDFPSAIPTSCNIGIRNSGSGTAASNWSSDVHDASNSSTIYFCHDGPPGTPPGESPCPGTQQPSNFAGGSLYQDVFKASDGTWHISMQVFTRQSYNVSVRVHYSWTPCTTSC